MEIPALTTLQMKEVDRLMLEEYHISLLPMMENAGRNLAELARRMLGGQVKDKLIGVACGTGNNGGGGMVAARHLYNWGADVQVYLASRPDAPNLKDAPIRQWQTLKAMGLVHASRDPESADLLIDALIGYGLTSNPRGSVANWIERLNASGVPILALDSPSGLDTTTGIPANPCIRATATMTLALPKVGLLKPQAKPFVGELYLADIGVPPELFRGPSLNLYLKPIFSIDTIIRVE